MRFTIFGASGFIGSALQQHLTQQGFDVRIPGRDQLSSVRGDFGHVIYAIGLTADFRNRIHETVDAHICLLNQLLQGQNFQSFLYLSSTRIYALAANTSEDAAIIADPTNPDQIYNISKLAGEALCLSHKQSNMRVARLSNVYGANDRSENFLPSIIRSAISGHITLQTSLRSSKDYVSIDDVVSVLTKIALGGECRVYNVASGRNIGNGEIIDVISGLTGCSVSVSEALPTVSFPTIDTRRIGDEFGFCAHSLLSNLPNIVEKQRGLVQ